MALTWTEILESRKTKYDTNGLTVSEVYWVDSNDPYAVTSDAGMPTPGDAHPTLSNVYFSDADIQYIKEANIAVNPRCVVTLNYVPPLRQRSSQINANGEIWEWDMTAKTTHITNVALPSYQLTFDKDNTGGINSETAIGKDEDTVTGADVLRPSGALRVTKYFAKSSINQAFRQTLYSMENTLNNASWQDWTKYEVLFVGSRITYNENESEAQVVYNFLFGYTQSSPTYKVVKANPYGSLEANLYSTINLKSAMDSSANLYPFDYVSVKTKTVSIPESASGYNTTAAYPREQKMVQSVSVAKVYESSDFSNLGIVGP